MTHDIIEAAIDGLEARKQHIDTQIADLRAMLKNAQSTRPDTAPKRKFSAAARRRMREAQQRRWAAVKAQSTPAAKPAAKSKPKRKLSAAGRKAISEAAKKRWAAKKAAKSA